MPRFASFARALMVATFAVVLAGACGGQSFTNGGDGDAGSGSGSTGGSGQGGSTNHAGTSSTAGKGHAGTNAGGGSAGSNVGGSGNVSGTSNVGGTGVAGAPASEECAAPPVGGNCGAYIPSWYNDPSTGICRPFVYGGCGGNANRYPSLEACQKACPGGNPNYDSCKLPSDCLVTGTGCCGICDSPNISAHDLIAYNKQFAGLLQCGLALDIAAGGASSAGATAPIACAPCPPPQGAGTLKYFVPDCVAGQCVVTDLRTSAVTACKTNDDCKLRHGTSCCEGCTTTDIVSVRSDGSFEKLVCSGGPTPCPACLPAPTDAVAICGADNHCAVAIPLNAGTAP